MVACAEPPAPTQQGLVEGEISVGTFQRAGFEVGCQSPDIEAQTCNTTYHIDFGESGTVEVISEFLMPAANPRDDYRITAKLKGMLDEEILCLAAPDAATFADAQFEYTNRPTPERDAQQLLETQLAAFAAAPTYEYCIRLLDTPTGYLLETLVDGAVIGDMTAEWIWLSSSEDWEVR